MIKFNPSSIYNRAMDKLQQDPNWRVVANNSVTSALLRSEAEVIAELARYSEYLFRESKWDTAQNPNSILAMANMLGYQPTRKIAATGKIYVSLDDRTRFVGKDILMDNFEKLSSQNLTVPEEDTQWVTPSKDINISSYAKITDENNTPYIAHNATLPAGAPYAILDVIQGRRETKFIDIATIRSLSTRSNLNSYLYIPVTIDNCEDAGTPHTRPFFKVSVLSTASSSSSTSITETNYRIVDSLLLSNETDHDVEVYNDLYDQNFFYLKFKDNLDISSDSSIIGIKIEYVVSLGENGNLKESGKIFTLTGTEIETKNSVKLYGVNLSPIIGGKNNETVSSIKMNAPKTYMKYYTAGTKEAYTNTILNTTFMVKSADGNGQTIAVRPKKVRVFGKEVLDPTTNVYRPVTGISFVSPELTSLANRYDDAYDEMTKSLTTYLDAVKSPQDTLKFYPPKYVGISLGVKCKINESAEDRNSLATRVRNFIDSEWGFTSDKLDFERDFSVSELQTAINNSFTYNGTSAFKDITTTVEATTRLNWRDAIRPVSKTTGSGVEMHTIRLPFSFSKAFMNETAKAEGTSSAFYGIHNGTPKYVMRIDFFYKKPSGMRGSTEYHKSIFIEPTIKEGTGTSEASNEFYLMHESSSSTEDSSIWRTDYSNTTEEPNYTMLKDIAKLTTSKQIGSVGGNSSTFTKVYDDADYITEIGNAEENSSSLADPTDIGYITDYLVYYSDDMEADENNDIAKGFIEIPYAPIFNVLSVFANYDSNISNKLRNVTLAQLQCNAQATNGVGIEEMFETFKDLAEQYVYVYVSLRPYSSTYFKAVDTEANASEAESVIFFIDTENVSLGKMSTSVASDTKKYRMIYVECE